MELHSRSLIQAAVLSSVFFWPNLHIRTKPRQHRIPVGDTRGRFDIANMPGGGGAYKLDGYLAHHFERYIELFRLLNWTAQIVFRMQEECRRSDLPGATQR